MSATGNATTKAIRLRNREYELLRAVAEAEGRTLLGVVGIAMKMYAAKRQPQILASLYGEDVPVPMSSLSQAEIAALRKRVMA